MPCTPSKWCGWSWRTTCPAAERHLGPGAAHPVISKVLEATEGLEVALVSSFCASQTGLFSALGLSSAILCP